MGTDTGFVISALELGGGLVGLVALMYVMFTLLLKRQADKEDKDRAEHMKKWDSMVAIQEKAVLAQKESVRLIIENHQKEVDRQYRLIERNTVALEALAHQVTVFMKEAKK